MKPTYMGGAQRPVLHYRWFLVIAAIILVTLMMFGPAKEQTLAEVADNFGVPQTTASPGPTSTASPADTATQNPDTINQRAAMVILIRNSELDEMVKTIEHFERRFNHRYGYPYIFLNNDDFTDHFTHTIRETLHRVGSKSTVQFGKIPVEHWGYPAWINQTNAAEARRSMEQRQIIYGGSESYRHMCRYQSGFFMWHPLLDGLEYYWRVEPSTRLLCDIPYDPFEAMAKNDWHYGFTISIKEYPATVETLWKATMEFVENRRQKQPDFQPELLGFFGDRKEYNMCHYWSNFEIASMKFVRSTAYTEYFRHLDTQGGFFYERWGDAPVHSIGAGLFLKKEQVHFFDDIGYYHVPLTNCPAEPLRTERNCDCEREKSADLIRGWSCVPEWQQYTPQKWFN